MKSHKGFTLIELLLVVSIMMGLALLEFQKMKASSDALAGEQAGKEFGVVIDALSAYTAKHMTEYQDMANHPAICVTVDADTCKLDMTALVREGLVGGGWQPRNAVMKSTYSAYIRRLPAGCGTTACNVEAFIRTDSGWTNDGGSNFLYGQIGAAARKAGPSAGMIKDGIANGLFEAWSVPMGTYPGMANGQLIGVVKVQGSTINQFVRVDGSLNMTGPLNMGNYRINDVKDIQLLGQSTLPRQGGAVAPMVSTLAPNWVLKGVYNVTDYDTDPVGGAVPSPTCPDSDGSSNGVPKILIKMTSMYNEMYGGMSNGTAVSPTDTQAQALAKVTTAFGGWNFYALEDTTTPGVFFWRTYIRRFYDNGYIPGEGLAEVYCYYP